MKGIKEKLEEIRNNPKLWKASAISAADMYNGEPPAIRIIDEILKEFETGKVLISVKEYDKNQKQIAWLSCLEMAGVDNWEGYSYAFDLRDEYYPEYKND